MKMITSSKGFNRKRAIVLRRIRPIITYVLAVMLLGGMAFTPVHAANTTVFDYDDQDKMKVGDMLQPGDTVMFMQSYGNGIYYLYQNVTYPHGDKKTDLGSNVASHVIMEPEDAFRVSQPSLDPSTSFVGWQIESIEHYREGMNAGTGGDHTGLALKAVYRDRTNYGIFGFSEPSENYLPLTDGGEVFQGDRISSGSLLSVHYLGANDTKFSVDYESAAVAGGGWYYSDILSDSETIGAVAGFDHWNVLKMYPGSWWTRGDIYLIPQDSANNDLIDYSWAMEEVNAERPLFLNYNNSTVSGVADKYNYTGNAITPVPIVVTNGNNLEHGIDFTLEYRENIEEGYAVILVWGEGDYASALQINFRIVTDGSGEDFVAPPSPDPDPDPDPDPELGTPTDKPEPPRNNNDDDDDDDDDAPSSSYRPYTPSPGDPAYYPSAVSVNPNAAIDLVEAALADTGSSDSVGVNIKNPGVISLETMRAMSQAAGGADMQIHGDTMLSTVSNTVDVRLSIDPSEAVKDINLFAHTSYNEAYASEVVFNMFFTNTFDTLQLEQEGSFGQNVGVAMKLKANMETGNLCFYSYDIYTNVYRRINTAYTVDANGYVHFDTDIGGTFIITDGPLVRR